MAAGPLTDIIKVRLPHGSVQRQAARGHIYPNHTIQHSALIPRSTEEHLLPMFILL